MQNQRLSTIRNHCFQSTNVNNGSHTTYVTCNVLVTNHMLNKVIFNGKIYYFVNKTFSAKDKFLKIQYDISGEFLSILKQTA